MKTSRRDSNRTQLDYLRLAAVSDKKAGVTEDEFAKRFLEKHQELARKAYQEAQ